MSQTGWPSTTWNKAWLNWARLMALAASVGLLLLVFRHLKFAALLESLRTVHKGWFIAAILVYGALFVPAFTRWHLLLKLNQAAVSAWTSARIYLIGHFFYVLLFGAIGGDTARSALYAHWHRQRLSAVLAIAPLDRLLGFIGLILFGLSAVLMASVAGGAGLGPVSAIAWKLQATWFIGVIVLGVLASWAAGRAPRSSFLYRFFEALTIGGRRLLNAPKIACVGVLCSVLVQAALSAALALSLRAVIHSPLPWAEMIWAFPFIALLGTLPVTVAGLGAREGAALLFLGLYGVSSAAAVAASLLTLAASLFWALVGGLLLFWEGRQREHRRGTILPGACHSNK